MDHIDYFMLEHKTKIVPLRWFANLCEKIAHHNLDLYLHYSDHDDYGLACRYHAYMSNIFYKPYLRWGTIYEVDMKTCSGMSKYDN